MGMQVTCDLVVESVTEWTPPDGRTRDAIHARRYRHRRKLYAACFKVIGLDFQRRPFLHVSLKSPLFKLIVDQFAEPNDPLINIGKFQTAPSH